MQSYLVRISRGCTNIVELYDFGDDEFKIVGNAPLFQLIRGALLFGAIGVASIYGMYQYDAIVGPGNIVFRNNITGLTLVFAVALFITSLSAEILVARIRG